MNRHPHIAKIALIGVLVAGALSGEVPDADHTFFGTPTVNGVLVEDGLVTVTVNDGEPLTSYTLGAVDGYGDRYVVRLPLDFAEPQLPGTARPGDSVSLFLDGELSGTGVVGDPGEAQELDIDPFFDDDPELSIDSIEVLEGDAGTTVAQFQVSLSRPVTFEVGLEFLTVDGTATAGSDYEATSGALTLEAFSTFATIDVAVFGDMEAEPAETFTVELQNATGGIIVEGIGTATIVADDTQSVLFVSPGEVLEGDLDPVDAVFTVSVCALIPEESGGMVAVDFATVDGTAQANVDYTPVTGTVMIDTSETCPTVTEQACAEQQVPCAEIAVPVLGDLLREGAETFTLELSNPSGAVIGNGVGDGSILDDEHFLLFREAEIDPDDPVPGELDGLAGAASAVVDPVAGDRLFAAARIDSAVTAFDRAPDGMLEFAAAYFDDTGGVDGIGGAEDLVLSPDGESLYVAGFLDDAVAVFSAADSCPEALCWVEVEASCPGDSTCLDGAAGLAMSPDGLSVYAVAFHAGTVVGFSRDAGTGELEFQQLVVDEGGGVEGLAGAVAVTVAPDGDHVYVASTIDSSVTAFARDGSGDLTFVADYKDGVDGVDGLAGAASVALSGDGVHLYVAGEQDDAIALFSRDVATGELTWLGQRRNNIDGVRGLAGISDLEVTADGEYLVTSSRTDAAAALFSLDAATGSLAFIEARFDGEPEIGDLTLNGLLGGSAVAVGPEVDGRSVYVAGSDDDGLAVFVKDTVAPDPPVVTSPSHQVGVWSMSSVIEVEWTVNDGEGSSGIVGYSFVFDESPDTTPDLLLDLAHDPGAPNQQATSDPLPDGDEHFFHVLACDEAGNCGEPAHFGPLFIDATAPDGPDGVMSTSHVVGEPSDVLEITMVWNPAEDATSGLDGYAAAFDMTDDLVCGEVKNLEDDVVSVTSPELEPGIWFFHICAVDNAGNWNSSQSFGPYVLDTAPPTVVEVGSVAATEEGSVGAGSATAITQLLIGFSEMMNDPAGDSDPADVTNPVNYLLAGAGDDGDLETTGCDGLGGDDLAVSIDRVTYEASNSTAALWVNNESSLPRDGYRLFACGDDALTDTAGNALDGDGDGTGGDDFGLDFIVTSTNFLANPNFDEDLDGWTAISPEPNEIDHDPSDADGALTSGSARVSNLSGPDEFYAVTQCVALLPSAVVDMGARFRVESGLDDDPLVLVIVDFFPEPDCETASISTRTTGGSVGDTAGEWVLLEALGVAAPHTAVSAEVSLSIEAGSSSDFEVFVDSAFLRETTVIFADGFESGDTSAWSTTVP